MFLLTVSALLLTSLKIDVRTVSALDYWERPNAGVKFACVWLYFTPYLYICMKLVNQSIV